VNTPGAVLKETHQSVANTLYVLDEVNHNVEL